jgi:hypothetical protein
VSVGGVICTAALLSMRSGVSTIPYRDGIAIPLEMVFIPRRNTNSTFNQLFGGRVFPGIFNKGSFFAEESADELSVTIRSRIDSNGRFGSR